MNLGRGRTHGCFKLDIPGFKIQYLTARGVTRHRAMRRRWAYALTNGKQLWRYRRVSNRIANAAAPITRGDRVFVSSDYDASGGLLELVTQDTGVDAKEIYFTRNMRNHYNTPVLADDHLYSYSSRILTCMPLDTGRGGLKRPRRREGASDHGQRAAPPSGAGHSIRL